LINKIIKIDPTLKPIIIENWINFPGLLTDLLSSFFRLLIVDCIDKNIFPELLILDF
jgi:hypothetical protein